MAHSPLTPTPPPPPPNSPLRTCPIGSGLQNGHCPVVSAHFIPLPPHVPPPHTPPHKTTTTTASHTRGKELSSPSPGIRRQPCCWVQRRTSLHCRRRPTKKFGLKMFESYASAHIAIYRVSFATPKTGVFLTLTISTTQISIYDNVIISVELVTKPTTPPHPPTKHAYQ